MDMLIISDLDNNRIETLGREPLNIRAGLL